MNISKSLKVFYTSGELNKSQTIINVLRKNPKIKARDLSKKFKVSTALIYNLKRNITMGRTTERTLEEAYDNAHKDLSYEDMGYYPRANDAPTTKHDAVNHPKHYTVGGIETIDFIEAKELNYNLGNVVKYITRSEHKGNKLEDLKKALWYLTREITSLEK